MHPTTPNPTTPNPKKLTPPDVVRAAYAELVVTDLARARAFYVDLLGFVVTLDAGRALYLRGYDELMHHNLILREGPTPAAARLAYRVRSAADLDLAEAFFAGLGARTARLPAGTTPGVGEAVRADDPLGFTVEFFADADWAERLQQRYDLRRGAEPARLDHFNIVVSDVRAAYDYYTSLGFGLSETIEDEDTLYAAWMFRKQTVHDVAFTGGAGPRVHHVAFFVHESHQVLRICDILGSLHAEDRIERGPGRHGVSNAFYVYLRDPDGHRVELYTSDYYTGDPGHPPLRWSVRDPRRRDFWGHPVVESWYTEASTVLDLDGRPRPLAPEKQPAEAGAARVQVGADGFTRLSRYPFSRSTGSSPSASRARSTFLSNLPTAVFGISETNVQFSGTCQRATFSPRNFASSAASAVAPARSTTQASGRSPQRWSEMPITAASCTAGCAISSFSRSTEEIHSPPDLITSLIRSVMVKKPRSSSVPTSPVRSQPSLNFSGAGSWW
jgi:3,4-dihydroxyphenylacetate 2,3-dioxygenase